MAGLNEQCQVIFASIKQPSGAAQSMVAGHNEDLHIMFMHIHSHTFMCMHKHTLTQTQMHTCTSLY